MYCQVLYCMPVQLWELLQCLFCKKLDFTTDKVNILNLPDPPHGEVNINNDSKEEEKDSDLLNLENLMAT